MQAHLPDFLSAQKRSPLDLNRWFIVHDHHTEKSLLKASQRFGVPLKHFSGGIAENIEECVGVYCLKFFH